MKNEIGAFIFHGDLNPIPIKIHREKVEFHGVSTHSGTTSRSPSVQLRPGAGSKNCDDAWLTMTEPV